ncbi:MAG: hypothetical protein ACTSPY_16525, partial [Candidatus Helarchaeota archaeon]
MSDESEEFNSLEDIVKIIAADMKKLLSNPIHIGLVDKSAKIKYIDPLLKEKYEDFILSFVSGNFDLLTIGEHSLPLSGVNIGFFKLSERSLIILYSESGPVGQLLAFKGRMNKYADDIDRLIDEEPKFKKSKVLEKTAYRVPIKLEGIEQKKFSMVEAKVIHLIDGKNTIEVICKKTNLPRLKVDEIIKKYQKKGWIKLKRIIITEEAEAPKKTKVKAKPSKEIKPKPKPVSPPIKEATPTTPEIAKSTPEIMIKTPSVNELYTDIDLLLKNTDPITAGTPSAAPIPQAPVAAPIPQAPVAAPVPEEIPEIPVAAPVPEEIPEIPAAAPIPEEIPEVPKAAPIPEEIPEVPKAAPIPEEIPEVPKAA